MGGSVIAGCPVAVASTLGVTAPSPLQSADAAEPITAWGTRDVTMARAGVVKRGAEEVPRNEADCTEESGRLVTRGPRTR